MRKEEEHREEKINKPSFRKTQSTGPRQRLLEETVPEDKDACGYMMRDKGHHCIVLWS